MCGIAGVYGDNALSRAIALMMGQLERGTQGCGVAYICNKALYVVKAPIHPVRFVFNKLELLKVDAKVAIAHNRQPSIGRVCKGNTHPFVSCDKRFVLIHNGSSLNYANERKELAKTHRFEGETDSELIMHKLEEYARRYGLIEGFERVYRDGANGAFLALTTGGKIYAARDATYPLHMYAKDGLVMLASSKGAFEAVGVALSKVEAVEDYEAVSIIQGKVKRYRLDVPRESGRYVVYYYPKYPMFGKWLDW